MAVSSAVPGRPTRAPSHGAGPCGQLLPVGLNRAEHRGPQPPMRWSASFPPRIHNLGLEVNPCSRDVSLSPASRGQPQMQIDRSVCFLQTMGVWDVFPGTCLPPNKLDLP